MSKIKNYGLFKELNLVLSYDELVTYVKSLKSLKGLSVKHLKYLAETKNFIRIFVEDGFTLKDIKYALIHGIKPKHVFCPICKVEIHSNGYGYSKTCKSKSCHYKQMELTLLKTCLEKYGVTSVLKLDSVIQKQQLTKLERYGTLSPMPYLSAALLETYGVSCSFDVPGAREKTKNTMLERYGCEYALESDELREKGKLTKLERYGDENYNNPEKGKLTKLERYGDENYNNPEKGKLTFIEHYGVDNNMKSPIGLSAYCKSINEKYGTDFVFLSDHFKEKAQETCIERYGVKHHMLNKEIQKKIHVKYTYDDLNFDSSWELAFWIYCKDHNIKIEHETVLLNYVDNKNVKHIYYPDFNVNDKLVEIKGDDLFDKNGKMIDKMNHDKDYIAEAKQLCMLENNVTILKSAEIQKYLSYIDDKYGKDYLKLFKNC